MTAAEGRDRHIEEVSTSRREDPSRCSRPAVVQILSAGWFIHGLWRTRTEHCVFKGVPRRVRIQRVREWTSSPSLKKPGWQNAHFTIRKPCSNTVGTFRQEMDIVLVGRVFLNMSA